jgi:hypothetical protein
MPIFPPLYRPGGNLVLGWRNRALGWSCPGSCRHRPENLAGFRSWTPV